MVIESDSEFQKKHPALHRWATRAGIHVAGDQQIAIVDRFGQFDCFKGPGRFTLYRVIGQTPLMNTMRAPATLAKGDELIRRSTSFAAASTFWRGG